MAAVAGRRMAAVRRTVSAVAGRRRAAVAGRRTEVDWRMEIPAEDCRGTPAEFHTGTGRLAPVPVRSDPLVSPYWRLVGQALCGEYRSRGRPIGWFCRPGHSRDAEATAGTARRAIRHGFAVVVASAGTRAFARPGIGKGVPR